MIGTPIAQGRRNGIGPIWAPDVEFDMLLLLNRALLARVNLLLAVGIATTLFAGAAMAQSPSHAYINQTRSSVNTNYFVSIGAEGEFGVFASKEKGVKDGKDKASKEAEKTTESKWQGYGIRNEIGLEFLKFLQFNLGHTSLNLRSKDDSTENLSGSRFHGGAALAFYAPLGNLSFGGGFLGSRLDYRRQDNAASYYGSGLYYEVGYNYFLNYNVSFYLNARRNQENLVRNSGQELPSSIQTETTSAGMGFKIWL
jgi:hypothetical protein